MANMEQSTQILLSIIKSGSPESKVLILENRETLIEALTREYDQELAGVVFNENPFPCYSQGGGVKTLQKINL